MYLWGLVCVDVAAAQLWIAIDLLFSSFLSADFILYLRPVVLLLC